MDDAAVVLSLGAVEGWLEKAVVAFPQLDNSTALAHLRVVEDALVEQRRNIQTLRDFIQRAKRQLDAANDI